jgi:hypothetical protein
MRRLIALLMLITILLTACGGDSDSSTPDNTPIPPTLTEEATTPEAPPLAQVLMAENTARDRLLQISQAGEVLPLFTFTSTREDNRIMRCDDWLDSGALLYIGAERGDLVLYADGSTIPMGQVTDQGCLSSRRFGPAGLVYLDAVPDRPYGMLNITTLAADAPRYTLDHVTAFDPLYEAILTLRLYADENDQITTADLDQWTASGPMNLGNFAAMENCTLTGGAVAHSSDTIFTILGQQCADETTWRLFSMPAGGGDPVEITSGPMAGGGTMRLFAAGDGSAALAVLPDSSVQWINRSGAIDPVLEGALDMRLSPDGIWVAVATTNGLHLIDLDLPGRSAHDIADIPVRDLDWGPGGRLFYLSDDGAISVVIPNSTPTEIIRGPFTSIQADPSGRGIAASEGNQVMLIDLAGTVLPIWSGAEGSEITILGVE